MPDLFSDTNRMEHIPIEDANISYLSHVQLGIPDADILRELIAKTDWRQEEIVVWGKKYNQPRLIAWHGDAGNAYSYSGISLNPHPWTDLLLHIKTRIEPLCDSRFNSVLLNYYRNNNDSMGFHSDDEPELGGQPTIASLSLGEERTLVFKHKVAGKKLRRIKLASGSLLVMKGDTQKFWKHGIEKETRPSGARVNLTFRRIITR